MFLVQGIEAWPVVPANENDAGVDQTSAEEAGGQPRHSKKWHVPQKFRSSLFITHAFCPLSPQIFYVSSFFYTLNYVWVLYTGLKEKYHRWLNGLPAQVSTRPKPPISPQNFFYEKLKVLRSKADRRK